MLKDIQPPLEWVPSEIIVRVVEDDGWAALAQPRRPEAGVYDPSFSLWDGLALLDYLSQVTDIPKRRGEPAPVLLLNLLVPRNDSAQPLL